MATGDKNYDIAKETTLQEILSAVQPRITKIETNYCSTGSSGTKTLVDKTGKGVLYISLPDQTAVTYTIVVDGVEVCKNTTLSYSTAISNTSALPIPFNESVQVVCNSTESYIVRYTLVLY